MFSGIFNWLYIGFPPHQKDKVVVGTTFCDYLTDLKEMMHRKRIFVSWAMLRFARHSPMIYNFFHGNCLHLLFKTSSDVFVYIVWPHWCKNWVLNILLLWIFTEHLPLASLSTSIVVWRTRNVYERKLGYLSFIWLLYVIKDNICHIMIKYLQL